MSLTDRIAAMPPVRQGLDRFNQLEPRDRFAAKSLAVFLSVVVCYFGAWEPMQTFAEDARADRDRNRDLLTWMVSTRAQASQQSGTTARRAGPTGQMLLTRVSRTAQHHQIKPNRLQPEGEGNVSVWFDGVAFDSLIRWLQELETREGISVQQISLDRQDRPGLVNARIVLRS